MMANGIEHWLAGFIYRGRAPWESAAPDYHVEIGEYVEVPGRDPVMLGMKVLTPSEADAAGLSLSTALAEINAEALSELSEARTIIADITPKNAALTKALEQAQADATEDDIMIEDLKAKLSEALDKIKILEGGSEPMPSGN